MNLNSKTTRSDIDRAPPVRCDQRPGQCHAKHRQRHHQRRRWGGQRTAGVALMLLMTGWCHSIRATESTGTTKLAVTGEIVSGACTIELGNGGKVDYGTIALSSIPETGPLQMEEKQVPFTIRCDDPMTIHLSARDSKPLTAVRTLVPRQERYAFGLGSVGDVNIGQFQLRVLSEDIGAQDAQRKVVPVDLIYKFFNLERWGKLDSGVIWADGSSRLSFAAPGKKTAGAYRFISGVFAVKPIISKRGDLPSGRIPLDGLASIDIFYQ